MRHNSDGPDGARQEHRAGRWLGSIGLALVLAVLPAHGQRLVFSQVPLGADGTALPDGSRIVSFEPSTGEISVLTGEFAAAGHPDLSFDGRKVLFAGKREPTDPFGIWELDLEGGDPRRIVRRPTDCTQPVYLSTLYTLDAEGPVRQVAFVGTGEDRIPALFSCRMDGSRVRRIAFDPLGVRDPYLLGDGRLLYATEEGSGLFTIHTDGTDVSAFAAVHEPPARRGMPCETHTRRVIYVESNGDGGALIAVSRARSLTTRRVLLEDPAGSYHSPFALADGRLLLSYRHGDGDSYGLHILDPTVGTRVPVFDTPDWEELDAVAVSPRREPPGRSSVVDERFEYGYLYGLDAYLSDAAHGGPVERGSIERLQLYRATAGGEELLGDAPVKADGSFHLEVPARTPLRLRTVRSDGTTVRAMQSWFWVMPMEARGCIGCHEDREMAPPNRHALALRTRPHAVGVPPHTDLRESQGRYGYVPPYRDRKKREGE